MTATLLYFHGQSVVISVCSFHLIQFLLLDVRSSSVCRVTFGIGLEASDKREIWRTSLWKMHSLAIGLGLSKVEFGSVRFTFCKLLPINLLYWTYISCLRTTVVEYLAYLSYRILHKPMLLVCRRDYRGNPLYCQRASKLNPHTTPLPS